MVNSHYVPQFILRHFCEDDKIQYYDIEKHNIEQRTTKSVFSEKGYYPDELERELCHKIEIQFAKVLNNKILCENYRIILSEDDMFILKKFLIISALRVKDYNLKHNSWYQALKRDGFVDDEHTDLFSGDFYENINTILKCNDKQKMLDIAYNGENMNLFSYIKDILCAYTLFVRTNNCKEDFIMPDRGWAGYMGPISIKKINALFNLYQLSGDPFIGSLVQMVTPHDYTIFPLSKNLAVINMSPAFKTYLPGSPYKIIFPEEAPTLLQCLGFGNTGTIKPPEVKNIRSSGIEYRCDIQQLSRQDVIFLNSLLLSNADQFFGFANEEKVKASLENSKSYEGK